MMTSPEHEVAYQEICKLVNKHGDSVSSLELLAIAANMVGKLIALQDQRTVTTDYAMYVVLENLSYGNMQALEQISSTKGSA